MALIPGTLPNDTCYGTPQDLLELFAQYLDVPAFALNSKVVFGTSSAGLTADVIWFDTTAPTNPILKITVSGGFTDYIKNYITSAATVTIVGADSVLILDASDSGNTKKGLVSDIAALAVPADGSITPIKLSQPFTRATAVATTSGNQVTFTGIPSWATMITVIFNAVSIVDGGDYLVRIGSGSIATTGYVSTSINNGSGGGVDGVSSTIGYIMRGANAPDFFSGLMHIVSVSGNTWVSTHRVKRSASNISGGGGDCTISGVLDRVSITSTTSATFDFGSVNIIYQG
jgi:hypothetical protein